MSYLDKVFDDMLDTYRNDLNCLTVMVDNVCLIFPELDRGDVNDELHKRASARQPKASQKISKEDLVDALLIGDNQSGIDYLLSIYPDLAYEEVKSELKSARKSSKEAEAKKRKSSKEAKKSSKKRITDADINRALEFYSYQFNEELREKITTFMIKKYPTLTRNEIVDQLSEYDFSDKVATPQKTRTTTKGEEGPKTPSRRGDTFLPVDFSPSSYGAAGSEAMKFYKTKRSEYLPGYVSPPRTPMPPPGLSTPKRFREDRTPPPSPSPRSRRESSRKLSFTSSSTKFATEREPFLSTFLCGL